MEPSPCVHEPPRPAGGRSAAWRAAACALLVLPGCLLDPRGTGDLAGGGALPTSTMAVSSSTSAGGAGGGGAPATTSQSSGSAGGDPCGPGAPDTDGDGVADGCDACPGHDDAVDADGDGAPDGCDTCPLDGPLASVPSAVTAHPQITISNAVLGSGPGNVVVAAPGSSVPIAFHWKIEDCDCTGCIDQIEVGVIPGGPLFCAYDDNPPCGSSDEGDYTGSFSVPSQPGVYAVRVGLRQAFDCNLGTNWWQGEPAENRTFGAVCVMAP